MSELEELNKRALKVWGENSQINMAIEEMSELIHALTRYLRNDGRTPEQRILQVIEEIVDVEITLAQMRELFIHRKKMDDTYKLMIGKKQEHLRRLLDFVEQDKALSKMLGETD